MSRDGLARDPDGAEEQQQQSFNESQFDVVVVIVVNLHSPCAECTKHRHCQG